MKKIHPVLVFARIVTADDQGTEFFFGRQQLQRVVVLLNQRLTVRRGGVLSVVHIARQLQVPRILQL